MLLLAFTRTALLLAAIALRALPTWLAFAALVVIAILLLSFGRAGLALGQGIAVEIRFLDPALDEALDRAKLAMFVVRHERYRKPAGARAAGAADAMHVVFRHLR